jgi:cytoskeleton protein RodZ
MTDDVENQQDETAPEEPEGPLGGERLAEARREQQISVDEIAKELHLDEPKVRALERNEFDVLGAPVFAKGHLKTYAQLVHVDVADVMSDYYQLTRTTTVPPVISARPNVRQELSPGPWIAALVVVIIIASVYWWFTRPADPESQVDASPIVEDSMIVTPQDAETDAVTPSPATSDPEVLEPPVQEPVQEPVAEPVVENEAERESEPPPPVEDGQMRVLVTYSGDCWTEISDARGRRLLFDLGKDGRTVELSGAEPFNVLFGNPGNVSLRVNGQDYALPATSRPDRPMRLTISGS